MSLVKIFAKNITTARAARNMSQAELAKKVGISTSYVSMLERGRRVPPLPTVEKVAKALKKSPVEMLT